MGDLYLGGKIDETIIEHKDFDPDAMHSKEFRRRRILSNADSVVISESGGV